ncbi:hypothetical protein CGH12_23640 [Vibrio parahaemolyticus]|nr:hypothetical protein CGH12_23640 [Vibrio parahaemolyticus]
MKLNINNGKLFFCLPSSSSVLIQQRASRDHKDRIAPFGVDTVNQRQSDDVGWAVYIAGKNAKLIRGVQG